MNRGKIKNIIIVILLLMNAFLAAIAVTDYVKSRAYDSSAEKSLVKALAAGGITLENSRVLDIKAIPSCTISRDAGREKHLVSAVLGRVDSQDQGGNIISYTGENGDASFRGTGDFDVLMEKNTVPSGSDLAETSKDFLKKLGIYIDAGKAGVDAGTGGSLSKVTAMCLYSGRPIVNCPLELTYSQDNLLYVRGTGPLTDITENSSGGELDTATAVMRLIAILKSSGYVCSRITDISHCYKMDVAASGEGTLTPLWHFSTDIGDFYVNGITGKAETVTQNN